MTILLAPLPIQSFRDNNGNPLAGGLLYTYQAGTSTLQSTYTDATGTTPNTNPVVLNSRGEASVWLTSAQAFKLVLQDSYGVLIWSVDQVASGASSGANSDIVSLTGLTTALSISQGGTGAITATAAAAALGVTAAADLAAPGGAGLVGFFQAGTGAVARTLQVKERDIVSVKDFGAIGDGITDDTTAISASITYALSQYARLLPTGNGGTYPTKAVTVLFPPGTYKTTATLVPTDGNYSYCNLQGLGLATILYTGVGRAINISSAAALSIMVAPVVVRDLTIKRDSVKANGSAGITLGTIGLYTERLSSANFEGLIFYGFDIAIYNAGSEDCLYNFAKKGSIEHCNIGLLIEQKTTVSSSIIKPNLTTVRDGYFISCYTNSVLIRKNPGESAVNNGSGGLLSFRDINFQGGSAVAISIDSPGEVPGGGVVTFDDCWFEGYGTVGISLKNGRAKLRNCFMVNGSQPLLLNDNISKFILEETSFFFGNSPVNNAAIQRADGTSEGIFAQVDIRNVRSDVSGIAAVNITPKGNELKNTVNTGLATAIKFTSGTGSAFGVAGSSGFVDLIDFGVYSTAGAWLVHISQADGGIIWRSSAIVFTNSIALSIITLGGSNLSLSNPSGAIFRVTNTNPSAIDLSYSIVRIH